MTRRSTLRAHIFRCLALLLALGAVQAVTSPPSNAAPGDVLVQGQVIDADLFIGLEGAEVTAVGAELSYGPVFTDENGFYGFELPPGSYTFFASLDGYEGEPDTVAISEEAPDGPTLELTALPDNPVEVTGHVFVSGTDPQEPIQDAYVWADGPSYDEAYTDAEGGVVLSLAPGDYEINISADGYLDDTVDLTVPAGGEADFNVFLQPAPEPIQVATSVIDATTTLGIEGAQVAAYGPVGDVQETDASGAATLQLAPGYYEFFASAPGYEGEYREVDITETTTSVPAFELTPLPDPVVVTGSVVDAETTAGLAGAYVYAEGNDYDEAQTDGEGSYELALQPGTYEIHASLSGYESGFIEVEITEETTELPDIVLEEIQPGLQVVVSGPDGPAANALVQIVADGGSTLTETADQDGKAFFANLADGTYTVSVLPGNGYVGTESEEYEYTGGFATVYLQAEIDLSCEPAAANQGLTNIGFEDGLNGWKLGYQTESIQAVGADAFTSPWEGASMARIGESKPSSAEYQPEGPNVMCQDFVVTDPVETFAFNVFTYDYTGFDEFSFNLIVSDPATGETLANYEQGSWSSGTALKTSGWRGVQLDLADYVGDEVRLTFRSGGTSDDLYAFWVYLDSADVLPPTVNTDVSDVQTDSGSVTVDPVTGQITVAMPNGDKSDLTMTFPAECQNPENDPTSVSLTLNGNPFPATGNASGEFTATIPEGQIQNGALNAEVSCPGETTVVQPLGEIVLYDPSGIVSDAETGEPVVGAEVHLYKVPGWTAQGSEGPYPDDSCQSNLSKPAGTDWNQPAPTDEGVLVNAASPEIDPNVNPFITNEIGYYGWDVAAGCWYVTVDAEGYEPLTSPVVGVPPEVTDLDLELTPVAELENTGKPAITGTSKVDDVLSASTGQWSLDGLTFAYQWLRNGGAIDGATASTYTVVPADVDAAITVRVTASKNGFDDVSAVSDPVTGQLGAATQNTGLPTIIGTPRVDEVLTAGTGSWNRSGLSFAYQWLRNGTAIDGATAATYTVMPADVDQPISVRVTASKTGYQNGTAVSSAVTGQLGTASEATALPGITGTPKVDEQLTAGPGTWSRSGLTFAYQWLRGGVAIDGADEATYVVSVADVDQPISVRVTASKAGYLDGVAVSTAVTGDEGAAAQNTAPPTISGVARAAETLTASSGTWSRDGLGFTYQWLRDGVAIDGADGITYLLTKADVDTSITVRVTASKTGYEDGVADSAAVVPDVSQACTDAQSELASATAAASAALKAYNAAKAKSAKAAKKVAAAAKKYKKNKTAKNKKKLVAAKKALKAAKKAEASAKKASNQAAAAKAAAQAAVDEAC